MNSLRGITPLRAEYIDHMGDDLRVVNAARVSFNKESDLEYFDADGERIIGAQYWEDYDDARLSEKDTKLISYLARNSHWTPFSHCTITLRETVPIFVARQRFKHMVGFTYNEVSRRYVDDPPEFFTPDLWRKASDNKKQGSSEEVFYDKEHYNLLNIYEDIVHRANEAYTVLIELGVAPEQARMVLPQSMYTSYYVTGSLAAWARAYKLRSDFHAQKEIQTLANQWSEIIKPLFPVSWEALITKGT